MRLLAWLVSLLSLHAAVNRWAPATTGAPATVSVLVPARDEAHRIGSLLASLPRDVEVLVLDDQSSDGTGDLVRAAGFQVLDGAPPPEGWLGKPWACQQLADAASGEVLVFVDADVVLAPGAVAATVAALDGLDLVSPYPHQAATGAARLVQPLLQWSILTFLPSGGVRSPRPSASAANGQLLAVRRMAYDRAGGHAAVRDQVVEDVALLREVKRAGGRGGVVDGTRLATTRMYDGWRDLADGYTKSLHTVPAAVPALLLLLYVVPWFSRRPAARVACAAGVAGRAVAAARTGSPVLDSAAHPVSVTLVCALWVRSRLARTRTWKGRRV